MAKISFRQDAIDDLNEIWNYTVVKWSEKQADKYYSKLKFDCEEIGKDPIIGRRYSEVKLNLLGVNSGNHIIFYIELQKIKLKLSEYCTRKWI